MHEKKSAKRYYASGTVQGVGYRYFVERVARKLNIAGYTRNLSDGRVEVYAIGPARSLAELRRDLERGPSGASVTIVTDEESPIEKAFEDRFTIEHDA